MSLSSKAVDYAAKSVLKQLSERLNISKLQAKNDETMECLQFGICTVPIPARIEE